MSTIIFFSVLHFSVFIPIDTEYASNNESQNTEETLYDFLKE